MGTGVVDTIMAARFGDKDLAPSPLGFISGYRYISLFLE